MQTCKHRLLIKKPTTLLTNTEIHSIKIRLINIMINRYLTIEGALEYLTQGRAEYTMIGSKEFDQNHFYIKNQQKIRKLIEEGKCQIHSTTGGQKVINMDEDSRDKVPELGLWSLTDEELNQRPYLQWTVGRFPLEDGTYSNTFLYGRQDEYWNLLDELTVNAIEHGSNNCQAGPVNIQCTATKKGVLVTIIQPKPGPSQEIVENTKPGQNHQYQPDPINQPKYIRGNGRNWIAKTDIEVNFLQSESGGAITVLFVKV